MVKKAKQLVPGQRQKLKLPLLAEVSSQHLVPLLRVLFASNGIEIEEYVAGCRELERTLPERIEFVVPERPPLIYFRIVQEGRCRKMNP
jgi:hypothetical protein